MIIDYVSGIIVGARGRSKKTCNGALSSTVAFNGIAKKVFIIINVLVIVQISPLVESFIAPQTLIEIVVWFYVGHEGMSIFENGGLIGVKYPKKVKQAFDVLIGGDEQEVTK
jgi:toxin secretion/phage lysis holin